MNIKIPFQKKKGDFYFYLYTIAKFGYLKNFSYLCSIKRFLQKEADDALLKTLYIDRQCSISIISTVFNKKEQSIKERLIELNLLEE